MTMPILVQNFQTIDNVKHVQFERLLKNPGKVLEEIYEFCGLDCSRKVIKNVIKNKNIFRFKKINPNRAYVYKRSKIDPYKFKIRQILVLLNQLDGVKYDLSGV